MFDGFPHVNHHFCYLVGAILHIQILIAIGKVRSGGSSAGVGSSLYFAVSALEKTGTH
jgi:hypothetical protein